MSAPAPPPTNVAVSLVDYVSEGKVTPQHFVMLDTPALTEADVPEGGCLLELAYLSVDPYMRGRMRNTKGYFVGPFVPGSPLDGACVATVSASRSPSLPVGSIVTGFLKWQKQQVVDKDMAASLTLVDKSAAPGVPLSAFLGPLGMTGLTAYASLRAIGRPKSGETAYVSAAGGAVGCMAGQLLKRVHGCRVVGSTGSDEKVAYLKSVGFDDAFNYNTTRPSNALKAMCPNGIDVYFDNVGGETLEAAIDNMNTFGRIVGCGQISQYNVPPEEHYGVHNLFNIVTKRLLFQGFIVGDKAIAAEHGESFKSDMLRYVSEGLVGVEVQEVEGLASAGAAFCEMMAGKNTGKMVVRV